MSLFLDFLRFGAAIVVVLGHFTAAPFIPGWPDLVDYAVAAVSVFFVISGFVISYVVSTREQNPVDYTVARLARLYSVMVPAILFCCLVEWICVRLDPAYVARMMAVTFGPAQASHHALHFVVNTLSPLTFLNMVHNRILVPDFDPVIWSLGFEAPYYALFGIAMFTRGPLRLLLLAVLALVLGGGVFRLLPPWLAGVALQRFLPALKPTRAMAIVTGLLCLLLIAAGCFVWPIFSIWVLLPHTHAVRYLLYGAGGSSKAYLFYFWGVLASLLIVAAHMLEAPLSVLLVPLEKPIRLCAGKAFAIYLFHIPLFVLAYCAIHYDRASPFADAGVFLAVIAICFLISTVTESKKLWWRDLLHAAFARILPAKQVI
jgi:peptidoglycan/LPS O-acetylase OafA/YrhL